MKASKRVFCLIALSAIAACVLWSYWTTLTLMFRSWTRDPVHSDFGPSHGAFVPVLALIVLWSRLRTAAKCGEWRWEQSARRSHHSPLATRHSWLGVAVLLLTLPLRWFANYADYVSLDAFTIVPAIAGLTMLFGGLPALRVSWPAIAMLVLMLPWPFPIEQMVTEPLRHVVAAASVYLLQTLGYPIFLDGPVMWIEDIRVEVIDACSGLGMLLTFGALALTVALVSQIPRLNRIIIVLSAPAFALFTNVLRIAATGAAYYAWGPGDDATTFVHDLAGWLMMPVAFALLWLELKLLDHLLIPALSERPLAIMLGGDMSSPTRSVSEPRRAITPHQLR